MMYFWQERIESIWSEIKAAWDESHTFFTKYVDFPLWLIAVLSLAIILIPVALIYDLLTYCICKLKNK